MPQGTRRQGQGQGQGPVATPLPSIPGVAACGLVTETLGQNTLTKSERNSKAAFIRSAVKTF